MTERHSVRVDRAFFDLLDDQLGEERGPNGEPSASDFLLVDLPLIAEAFATRFESLSVPEPEHPEFRSLVISALLVPSVMVTGVPVQMMWSLCCRYGSISTCRGSDVIGSRVHPSPQQ